MKDPLNIRPGSTTVRCKDSPEWGTFVIRLERKEEWYEISGSTGCHVLHFSEAAKHWEVVTP